MNIRFGDYRYRQSKVQKNRQSELGSGRRRADPSVHATSRPWHTSTPGIRMNVTTNAQIAKQAAGDSVQQMYLNRMKVSERAQQKQGHDAREEGRQYDKQGLAMLRGLQHSQGRGAMPAPNADVIARYERELSGRIAELGERPADLPPVRGAGAGGGGRAALMAAIRAGGGAAGAGGGAPAAAPARVAAEAARRREQSLYDRHLTALKGMKGKTKFDYDHHKYRR